MFERFTEEARAVVLAAQTEARVMAHGAVGTEHLLLGLLAEPERPAARLLARWGVDGGWARGEVERLVENGEPGLDAGALATLGIDLEQIRARVEETFGPGALARGRQRRGGRAGGALPFSPAAKKALELSLREALALKDNFIGSEHILLGVLRVDDGLGARLLRSKGVGRSAVVDALRTRR